MSGPGRVVIDGKELLVEGALAPVIVGKQAAGVIVAITVRAENNGLIGSARDEDRDRITRDEADAFGVDEEERLILYDRSADSGRPFIVIREGTGVGQALSNLVGLVEPLVGIQGVAVPEVAGVSMEAVGTRTRSLIDLGAAKAAKHSAV